MGSLLNLNSSSAVTSLSGFSSWHKTALPVSKEQANPFLQAVSAWRNFSSEMTLLVVLPPALNVLTLERSFVAARG